MVHYHGLLLECAWSHVAYAVAVSVHMLCAMSVGIVQLAWAVHIKHQQQIYGILQFTTLLNPLSGHIIVLVLLRQTGRPASAGVATNTVINHEVY